MSLSVSLFAIQYWQLVAIFATQSLGHPIVAELIKKRGKCIKSHTLAPKFNVLLHFSGLRALILRYNN